LEKGYNQHKGRLEFDYNIEQNGFIKTTRKKSQDKGGSMGVALLLGTLRGGYLLSQTSFVVLPRQSWTKHIVMDFDWSIAGANAGQDQNHLVVLRVLHEFLSDLDFEIIISLKH
jgi:hypothetical protein